MRVIFNEISNVKAANNLIDGKDSISPWHIEIMYVGT